MGKYTLLRVESSSGLVNRLLGITPGVEVGENPAEPVDGTVEFEAPAAITDRLGPAIREYGLLGAGASLATAGLAAVGLWWKRRRRDESGFDSPAEIDRLPESDGQADDRPDSDTQPTGEPIDAAPLLGLVFLTVTGAVVRWVQRVEK